MVQLYAASLSYRRTSKKAGIDATQTGSLVSRSSSSPLHVLPSTNNAYIQLSDGRSSLAARQYPVPVVHYTRTSKRWIRTPSSRRRDTQALFDETLVHISWFQPMPATPCRWYCAPGVDATPRPRVSSPNNGTSEVERRRRLKRKRTNRASRAGRPAAKRPCRAAEQGAVSSEGGAWPFSKYPESEALK